MDERYVSTGRLPELPDFEALVSETFERYRGNREGALSDLYPELARRRPDAFAISVIGTDGVKRQLVARFLSRRLGLDVLGSEPVR
jgi:hypothetical protein